MIEMTEYKYEIDGGREGRKSELHWREILAATECPAGRSQMQCCRGGREA